MSVDDFGIEVLKKAGIEFFPNQNNKSEYIVRIQDAASRKHTQLYNLVNTGFTLTTLDLLIDNRDQYITLNSGQLIYTS